MHSKSIETGNMGIYKITNILDKKVYIGSTVNFKKRFSSHKKQLNDNTHHNFTLQKDWNRFGESKFTFEVIKEISDQLTLAKEEKKEINEYKKLYGVYNLSDPMEESINGRFERKIVDKGSAPKRKRHKYSKKEIIEWLDGNYKDKMRTLHNHIDERKFYIKESVDNWFLSNISNKEILEDDRILGILNAWYNKSGFNIVDPRIYKSAIKNIYNIRIETDGHILVTPKISLELYNYKFRRRLYEANKNQ